MRISDWSSDVCSSDLAIAAGIAKNGKRSSPDRPTAPLRMGNHYPECGACQPVRQAADAPKLHTPSRACTSWEQREHKAAALRKSPFLPFPWHIRFFIGFHPPFVWPATSVWRSASFPFTERYSILLE